MITRTPAVRATSLSANSRSPKSTWRESLRNAVRSLDELLSVLNLDPQRVGASPEAVKDFPLVVPRGFVDRMEKSNPLDPLLLQVLPSGEEHESPPGFSKDPLAEEETSPIPGILHKYKGRALVIATGACAVHCRYCFRRHFPYTDHAMDMTPALDYLASDSSIHEVILSGGDPLTLSDQKLSQLVDSFEKIPHVERLRLHTRLPVVLPERIDDSLLQWLSRTRLQSVVVIHSNHPNEIDGSVIDALKRLKSSGATLLNQTVLLRNVNDQVDILRTLSEALFRAGVLPYYLHVLDRVEGAAHFEVTEADARRLARRLLAELPGYLVPRLVREVAGAPSKTPISLF